MVPIMIQGIALLDYEEEPAKGVIREGGKYLQGRSDQRPRH